MAETLLLTFAVEQLLGRGLEYAIQEIRGVWGAKKDLRKLSEFIQRIHHKVKEAGINEVTNGQSAKTLLVKLQDVLYSAEDVLDDLSYEILRREIEIQSEPFLKITLLKIRGFASPNNTIWFRWKMAHKVKKINESLAEIEKQAIRDFALTGKVVIDPVVVSNDQPNRETVSRFDKSEPPAVGRESEVKAIINMLQVSSFTPSLLTVVSIVGFGGLGKTTLAKMVFHQVKETAKLFDETLWVCVSEPFDVKTILKGMLETLNENAGGLESVEAILGHLESKLKDKRFFLVLDDVWEDSSINCNTLKSHLTTICDRPGNFVIVTTRKMDVAEAIGTKEEHVVKLKGLEDKECWDIIRNKCEMQWGESVPEELEKVGVEVARKCKGVPLAARVVGGTLCKKKSRKEWLSIQNNDAWDQIDKDKEILPVLKLSFHHLHPSLKQCFVYCSLFPKDFEYEKQKLIEFWMAEGFLNTSSTENTGSEVKSMEDVGDECFNELLVHSFFQDVREDEFGNIIACKMHDLLHDVASSVSNYKMLNLNGKSTVFVRTSNHQHHPNAQELEEGGERNVRCVISKVVGEVSEMFSTFKSLRSLDISRAKLKELPSIVGKLKHLRYLDISDNEVIEELPGCITKLYNLQTIGLDGCESIIKLPTNMVKLARLRHIHFNMQALEIYNVGQLYELRTLPMFEVRKEEGLRIEELNKLNKLTGHLEIYSLENVRDKEEAERANLKEKKLIVLRLVWFREDSIHSKTNDEYVLEGLLPPPTTQRLEIDGYRGMKFPNWMCTEINNSQLNCLFPELKKLTLRNMESLEEWGAVGGIDGSVLEELQIDRCPRLRSIPLRHFPSLVRLSIACCEDMEYLSSDIQNLPSLDYLQIRDCKSLVSLSNLQQLKSLKSLHIAETFALTSLSNGLVSLETLQIYLFEDLSVDAFRGLSSLKRLSLVKGGRMESMPKIERPGSLEDLSISECPQLTSVPNCLKFSTSLHKLEISKCTRLISIDHDIISSLTELKELKMGPFSEELENFPGLNSINLLSSSLERLEIYGWPKLKSLPSNIQHLTSLTYLLISDFEGVEALPDWLGNLSSLQQLRLRNCENLKDIPTTINSLSNLTTLRSNRCPLLKRRYNKHTGPDRHLVPQGFNIHYV